MFFLYVSVVILILMGCWTIKNAKTDRKQREQELEIMNKINEQSTKQTKIMAKQLENDGTQNHLSGETTQRMAELALSMKKLTLDADELKQDMKYIKTVMVEVDTQLLEGSRQ